LEAAERGIPALAVSLEMPVGEYFEHNESVNFLTAHYFVHYFAERLLGKLFPTDVDVLKIDIPIHATPESPWVVTRQDRLSYYTPRVLRISEALNSASMLKTDVAKGKYSQAGTDAHAMAKGFVSITPLSLDCTSRTDLLELQKLIDPEYSSK
jgi:5'-nucleotidase